MKKVLLSGGFDPLHKGHVRYIKDAIKRWPDHYILVALNPDAWLVEKKGKAFMQEDERCEVVTALLRDIDLAIVWKGTTAQAIRKFTPAIFAKGGDRTLETLPIEELEACALVGCEIVTGVGGDKVQSSQALIRRARRT